MRLWDLRKMCSNTEFETFQHRHYGQPNFDYRLIFPFLVLVVFQLKLLPTIRHGTYVNPRHKDHPKDCSVMAYRGHQVFRTLIRCHFSPTETTGSNYVYTGSSDGKIHVCIHGHVSDGTSR